VAAHKYVQGYRVWFKRTSDPSSRFSSVSVSHPEADSFVITGLDEHTEYDLFVQSFYKGVLGRPSHVKRTLTHMSAPSGAPVISEARFVNETVIYLAWRDLNDEDKNGPITGFEVKMIHLHYYFCLSISIFQSILLSVCLSIFQSTNPSILINACLYVHLLIFTFFCLSVCPLILFCVNVHLFIRLPLCVSVFTFCLSV
jgi:hypothetical protein